MHSIIEVISFSHFPDRMARSSCQLVARSCTGAGHAFSANTNMHGISTYELHDSTTHAESSNRVPLLLS
jgi:hypothetical protein